MQATIQNVGCVKAATKVIGDKWTPELLRFIANEGNIRFCQLQELALGINPRTLSSRLQSLEKSGIIKKCPTSNSRCSYQLTDKGQDLIPILSEMECWGNKHKLTDV